MVLEPSSELLTIAFCLFRGPLVPLVFQDLQTQRLIRFDFIPPDPKFIGGVVQF